MSSIDLSSLGRTNLIGGNDGPRFNDINKLFSNGQVNLHSQYPIKQIRVNAGWVVDGITVTYRNADGDSVTYRHGESKETDQIVIDLHDTEVVAAIYGRAGYQEYYETALINSINFIIFDRQSCATRTVGPFGNGNKSDNGKPYYSGAVVAFGGYAQNDTQVGLRGLYFVERSSGSQNLFPIQVPSAPRSGHVFTGKPNPAGDTRKTVAVQPAYSPKQLPYIIYGLQYIDVGGDAIRVNAVIESLKSDSFIMNLQTWGQTELYASAVNWIDLPIERGLQGGIIPYRPTRHERALVSNLLVNVRFDRPYSKPPKVLVWLTAVDMSMATNYRVKTYAANVTEAGFVATAEAWSDSHNFATGLAWIAVPSDAHDIVVGTYSGDTTTQSGQVAFDHELSVAPLVIPGLSALDFQTGKILRCKTSVEDVTKKGFKWNLNTWSDSTMYWAQAAYIAIAEPNTI